MRTHCKWLLFYIFIIIAVLLSINWGNQAITTLSENMPLRRHHCIVIDPGHGGEDGGATSCRGIVESVYNLEISLRLNDLLNLMGFETKMIRTSDVSIYTQGETIAQKKVSDLKERVRIVNETENAILLSIHQNNFHDSHYSGAQIFYSDAEGSELLAKCMQSNFIATLNPGSNRQSKKSEGIFLMDRIEKPGVLIECGFLSNLSEEAKLRNPEYQKNICCVIGATLSQYLSNT